MPYSIHRPESLWPLPYNEKRHSNQIVDKNEQNVGRILLGDSQMIFQESETVELKAIVVLECNV